MQNYVQCSCLYVAMFPSISAIFSSSILNLYVTMYQIMCLLLSVL